MLSFIIMHEISDKYLDKGHEVYAKHGKAVEKREIAKAPCKCRALITIKLLFIFCLHEQLLFFGKTARKRCQNY